MCVSISWACMHNQEINPRVICLRKGLGETLSGGMLEVHANHKTINDIRISMKEQN